VPLYLDEIGTCTAREVVAVRPLASGQITQILFTDGADIKKGDPLFVIDPRPYQALLDQAKASLAQNQADLQLAIAKFDRGTALLPSGAIAKEDYETRRAAVEDERALIVVSEAAIEAAKINLSYCYIDSPIDGRAGLRQIDIGNVVTAGILGAGGAAAGGQASSQPASITATATPVGSGPVLLTIQRMDPIYADFTITQRDLAAVRSAMAKGILKAQVRVPDEATAQNPVNQQGAPHAPHEAQNLPPREGDLTFLDNAVQLSTGTVALRATLPNWDRRFWPGQFVQVRLVLSTINAVLVPNEATQISQDGPYVYVIGPDSIAELRLVTIGQRQGPLVVITDGLKPGETVVQTGQLAVVPGTKVLVKEVKEVKNIQTPTGTSAPASTSAAQPSPSGAVSQAQSERGRTVEGERGRSEQQNVEQGMSNVQLMDAEDMPLRRSAVLLFDILPFASSPAFATLGAPVRPWSDSVSASRRRFSPAPPLPVSPSAVRGGFGQKT
jgi:multidrug efflux system membrane fusion protein